MLLQPLTAERLEAVLEFERVNHAYFAATVPDRGDGFFADYPARHAALLRMQAAGTDRFHLLVDDDGTVKGGDSCGRSSPTAAGGLHINRLGDAG